MRSWLTLTLGLILASCAYAPPAPPPPAPPPVAAAPARRYHEASPARVVHTRIGTVLANSHGMTLYTWAKDSRGESRCYGKCAHIWPPFYAPQGARPFDGWGITIRRGGAHQWTYRGHPLYTFIKDHRPGETVGNGKHGFGALWRVVRP